MNKPVILVADDSQLSREYVANILKPAGFDVIQAIDGGSALKVVLERNIAVAIIDHFMEPHGGFDFAREIRSRSIKLPMIMVTNEETSDLLIEISRYGIQNYLKKPVDAQRLLTSVQRALRSISSDKVEENAVVEIAKTHYTHEELLARALELATKNAASGHGGPFGAVIADSEGRVLGEGINGITSRCDPAAHAEIAAIRQATEALNKTNLEGCVLYSSSEPTRVSKALIDSVGISKVYYGLSHAEVRDFIPSRSFAPAEYHQDGQDAARAMFETIKR